jgi:hypothetical protein
MLHNFNSRTCFQEHFGCIASQQPGDNDITTAYYQWVVFVLLLNAALFLVPRKIWCPLKTAN